MINIKRILFLIFIMFCSRVKAQIIYSTTGNPSLMSLSGKFVEIDSQFYIIPKLDIYKKNLKIRIPQKRTYIDGGFEKINAEAQIFLLKQIGNSYAYISLGKLDDYARWSLEKKAYINYQKGSALNDTIPLQNIFPLEPGDYIAILQLSYWDGKKKMSIASPEIYFKILHKPKDSFY